MLNFNRGFMIYGIFYDLIDLSTFVEVYMCIIGFLLGGKISLLLYNSF